MVKQLIKLYEKRQTERDTIVANIDKLEESILDIEEEIEDVKQAKQILVQIGVETQNLFKHKIEDLVTSSLRGVFDRDYTFVMHIEVKRNKTECQPMVKKGDLILDPRDSMGGGVIDVAALAARIVLWSMERPRTLPIIVLDEPLKWVHGFEEEASYVIRRLSKSMHIQFLIISQIEGLVDAGDKIFMIGMKGNETTVEVMYE